MDSQLIINVLSHRKGFDDWWNEIDSDIQLEILQELDSLINEEL